MIRRVLQQTKTLVWALCAAVVAIVFGLMVWQWLDSLSDYAAAPVVSQPVSISITNDGFVPQIITTTTDVEVVWTNYTGQTVILVAGTGDYRLYLPLITKSGQMPGESIRDHEADRMNSVTADDQWQTPPIAPGTSYTYTFSLTGHYYYYRQGLPYLTGLIVVSDREDEIPPDPRPTSTPTPSLISTPIPTPTPPLISTPIPTPTPTMPPPVTEPAWHLVRVTESPPIVGEYAAAYDSQRSVMVVYGGNAAGWPYENRTWEFDGTSWSAVTTRQQPDAAYGAAMVYDSSRGVMVLFGGTDVTDTPLAQTWEYDGHNWVEQLTATSPPARTYHNLVYVPATGRIFLFGGNDGTTYYNDIWRYDGRNWEPEAFDGLPPAARTLSAMAYDPDNQLLFMFGGRAENGAPLADFWSFNPGMGSWQEIIITGPDARQAHSLVYDSGLESLILVGGIADEGDTVRGDTWHYQREQWVVADSLPGAAYHTLVYIDEAQGVLLLTNGQTWQYR